MGFIQLNGEKVHTILLDPNPIVEIINLGEEYKGRVLTQKKIYRYKDGMTQEVILTYTL